VPSEDAEVVRRLKAAGAIVLGKTNTPEFAAGRQYLQRRIRRDPHNPWNPELSPSGSSGGSAGRGRHRHGAFGAGHRFRLFRFRMPASFCGIVGIRPTPGLTPNWPMPLGLGPRAGHGPLARTAEDAALMLDAITGFQPDIADLGSRRPGVSARAIVANAKDTTGLRIAYVSDIAGIGVEPEIDAICRATALSLRDAGAVVEESRSISPTASRLSGMARALDGRQQFANLDHLEEFGVNLKGNVKAASRSARWILPRPNRSAPSCFCVLQDSSSTTTS